MIPRGLQGPIQSFFLVDDQDGRKLDGVSGEFQTAKRIYFPIVEQDSTRTTLFFVFNPAVTETDVTFTLYQQNGDVIEAATRTVAGGGFTFETAPDLFGSNVNPEGGFVEALAKTPLLGFEFLRDGETYSALAAQGAQRTRSLYAPQFAVGRGGATQLYLLATRQTYRDDMVRVRIRAFDNDGRWISGAERELVLAPNSLLVGDVGELLNLDPSSQQDGLIDGYLKLDLSQIIRDYPPAPHSSQVLGAVAFTQGDARAVLPLLARGRKVTSFLQVAQTTQPEIGLFTGLSILNPDSETVTVRLRVFDQKGQPSAPERIFQMAPGSRRIGLLAEDPFFGPTFMQVGGHFQVISDEPVISFALFGDWNLDFLSAIQGQIGIP